MGRRKTRGNLPAVVLDVPPTPIRLLGRGPTEAALRSVGAVSGDDGPTVVAEDALDAAVGAEVRDRLGRGERVLVLAQPPEAAPFYPVAVAVEDAPAGAGVAALRVTSGADGPAGGRPATVGSLPVGPGRLLFCQHRLASAAAAGDAGYCALLADLLTWLREPRPVMTREALTKDDGRLLWLYSWSDQPAQDTT
jgi:hypothetical protein